jgi:hypothetical protein
MKPAPWQRAPEYNINRQNNMGEEIIALPHYNKLLWDTREQI